MKDLVPLSVVVLTKNEEDNIGRCLASIKWCKDVLIIDNSTDQTLEKAKKIMSKNSPCIIKSQETEDFSRLRNLGLKKARYNWVLFLDADEEMPYDLQEEIKKVISESKYNAFCIKRQDYFLGKWLKYGETGDMRLLKLGKKEAGRWERRVHEFWNIKDPIGLLNSPLIHYPHPSISEFTNRINRWTTIDAEVFFEQGVRSSFLKIFAYPVGKFIRNYFIKLGFLDGMPGLIHVLLMSFHSFLTRAKLYMLQTSNQSHD